MEKIEQSEHNRSIFSKIKRFKKPGKKMFWAWIAYQTIKGSITLSFIWAPLLYMWFHQ